VRFSLSRWLIAVLVIVASAGGVIGYRLSSGSINERIQGVVATLQAHGPAGWLAIALLQALIAASGVVPAAAMGAAAGAIYGVWIGFLLTAAGTMIGASVAFLLARSIFRPMVSGYLAKKPYMARLDESISNDGWRMVCLLRVSPIMPFAAGSYALGLTSIDFTSYLIGSFAALPALLGYVFLGHLAKAGLGIDLHGAGWIHLGLIGFGILATLFLVLHIGSIAKRAMSGKSTIKS